MYIRSQRSGNKCFSCDPGKNFSKQPAISQKFDVVITMIDNNQSGLCTPPKTGMSLYLGVTGHRAFPHADPEALRRQIGDVLSYIRKAAQRLQREISRLHTDASPSFRMVSMLAEGSDRIVAECALERGYRLQCLLPMAKGEYEKDFRSEASRNEFTDLLEKAERVFEIEACTQNRKRAYQNCGRVMLGQIDLLIAIWDGQDSGSIGGTSDMVALAKEQDIPVVWIHSVHPHTVRVDYGDATPEQWETDIEKVIRKILLPWGKEESNRLFPETYFGERLGRRSFRNILSSLMNRYRPRSAEKTSKENEAGDPFYLEHYDAHFRSADELAKYYRDIYRFCSLFRQILPFLATVGLALGYYSLLFAGPGGASPAAEHRLNIVSNMGFLVQAVCFALIILLSRLERRNHWHQKFSDYRALAELLRQMKYLAPVGLVVRGLRAPAFDRHVNLSWVNWQFRAIVRQAGLPTGRADTARIARCLSRFRDSILKSQIQYHQDNVREMEILTRRLNRIGILMYYIGILIVVLRVGAHLLVSSSLSLAFSSGQQGYIFSVFNMLSLIIPLFSSLAFGISAQEGYGRILQLSQVMSERLEIMLSQVRLEKQMDFHEYMQVAQKAADLMLSEFSNWNVFFKSKTINIG